MKKYLFSITFLFLISCSSNNLDNQCQLVIDNLFQGIKNNKPTESLIKLISQNKNINQGDSATQELIKKFSFINSCSGSYLGNKLLLKRNITDKVIIYSYLVMYEKKFYRFIFIFYNPSDNMVPYKFIFDDNLEFEQEESLKLYLNNNIYDSINFTKL
jgi:hypothetical protein